MKVKELQDRLSQLDPELNLVLSTEGEKFIGSDELFKLFDVESISVVDAEPLRDNNRQPTLKIGKSDSSQKIVLVNIVSDF